MAMELSDHNLAPTTRYHGAVRVSEEDAMDRFRSLVHTLIVCVPYLHGNHVFKSLQKLSALVHSFFLHFSVF
jgi:hypothetical protein